MNLHFWPRMRIKHPTHLKGQLYIPMINLAMYIGVVLIILLFRDSSHMEAAYGLAITITVLAFNLLGDGIRDAFDPKARKRDTHGIA